MTTLRTIEVHPFGIFDTIITFTGEDLETGVRRRFAVDHRPAREIRAALERGEQPLVDVPGYLLLGGEETS